MSCVRLGAVFLFNPLFFQGFVVCLFFFFAASTEEALLEKVLNVSTAGESAGTPGTVDFNAMSEDEQIAYALRLSMENTGIKYSP